MIFERIASAVMTKTHVPSGSYYISESRALKIEAYLGTCVGLSLYCRSTGIGGVIHLLLPEPTSISGSEQFEKYATTGVPLFLQAMLSTGARRAALTACLAGGALVGPISKQDLDLDIGGRTADVVKSLLAREGIELQKSETGGFFTCRLSLDMSTGHTTIEPAGVTRLSDEVTVRAPGISEIEQAMEQVKPIPQVALKVMRLVDHQDESVDAITDEIRKDQVLTARTLQLANSALFAVKQPIASLDHAIVFLGQDHLIKLVISAAIQGYFDQSSQGYALCKGGIYHHALGCAHVAEILAKRTRLVEAAMAYTAGLVHDIGKVVLDQYVSNAYPLFYRRVMERTEDVIHIEKRLFNTDHTKVGFLLACRWSFPDLLADAIRHHHHPGNADKHPELAKIVYLADLLMSRFLTGLEIERLDTSTLSSHLDALGLKIGDFSDLVDAIPSALFENASDACMSTASGL
jgi:putative nucleotidyltransferase with HDIG domain